MSRSELRFTRAKFDPAMQGIRDANGALVTETRDPAARDLVYIVAGQVAAHFYPTNYETLRAYAEALGYTKAAKLLQDTLDETGQVDRTFTKLARHLISRSALPGHPWGLALTTAACIGLTVTGAAVFGRRHTPPRPI